VDLVPHLDVDLAKIHDSLRRVMPDPRVIELSARSGVGMDAWKGWLDHLKAHVAKPAAAREHTHAHGHGPSHSHGGGRPHSH
jgi:hydrogenase nickel incorporation protein HypB